MSITSKRNIWSNSRCSSRLPSPNKSRFSFIWIKGNVSALTHADSWKEHISCRKPVNNAVLWWYWIIITLSFICMEYAQIQLARLASLHAFCPETDRKRCKACSMSVMTSLSFAPRLQGFAQAAARRSFWQHKWNTISYKRAQPGRGKKEVAPLNPTFCFLFLFPFPSSFFSAIFYNVSVACKGMYPTPGSVWGSHMYARTLEGTASSQLYRKLGLIINGTHSK